MNAAPILPDLDLATILLCPNCAQASLSPISLDSLGCAECGRTFAIVNGIPRLAANPYVSTFGRQWNRYEVARPDEDRAVFEAKTGFAPESQRGQLLLDAGCGGGRYTWLLAEHGARIIGLDLSDAVEKAASLCAGFENARIVQGDLLELPLKDQSFDGAFSIGVLHHSPDPRRTFAQVAAKVKPGGWLAVWLYRRNTWPQEAVNTGLRSVTRRLPARVLEPLCVGLGVLGSIPVAKQTLNKVVNFSNHPDWTLRVCDNYDWYAPRYQSHHTLAELRSWFVAEGFTDLVELAPQKRGTFYDWAYRHNLIPGSGVNIRGTKVAGRTSAAL